MSLKVDRVQLEIEIKNDSSRKRLRELEDQINGMRKSMKKMKESSPEYDKQQKALQSLVKEHDGLIKKIGITNLSTNELRRRQKDLNSILRNMPPSNENYGAYKDEIAKVNARLKELRPNAKAVQDSLSKFGMSVQVFAGNMMTKAVALVGELVTKAKDFVVEGIQMADKAEGVVTAFNKLNAPDLLKNLRSETKGLVTDFQLMQTAVRANTFGIPLNNLGSLLKFAQQRAQETGESIDYLVDSIINGIGRKSPLILDNLGISASRLQSQTKKTGDFAAAAIEIVNEELEKQGDLALTSADKATQSAVKWENAQMKVGQRFQWLGGIWDKISGDMADSISNLAGDTRTASEVFDNHIEKIADLDVRIEPLTRRYDELKSKVELNSDEQSELNNIMNIITGTVPGVITEFDKYGNILSINTQKVYDYIDSEKARLQFINKEVIETLEKQREELNKEKELQESISQHGKYVFTGGGMFGGGTTSLDNRPETLQKAAEKVKIVGESLKGLDAELSRLTGKTAEEHIETQKEMILNRQKFTLMNAKELKTWIDDEKNAQSQYLTIAQSTYNSKINPNENNIPTPTTTKSTENPELKNIDNDILLKRNKLKQSYLDNKTDFETFNKEMEHLEMESLVRKLGIADLEPERVAQIEQQILDLKLKAKDKELKDAEKVAKQKIELEKWNEEETKKIVEAALKHEVSAEQQGIIQLMDLRRQNLITEKEYQNKMYNLHVDMLTRKLKIEGMSQEQIDSIRKELYQNEISRYYSLKAMRKDVIGNDDVYANLQEQLEKIDDALVNGSISFEEAMKARVESYMGAINDSIQQVGANLTGAMTNFQSAEESAISRKYDKQIKAAEGNSELQQKLEKEKEEELNKIRAEYADKQFAVQAAMIVSETSMAAMRAYSALAGIPLIGPALGAAAAGAAILFGASQLKVANEQRNAAKEGYQVGGFTPRDYRDNKAVGTVHANEFVANAHATRNPSVRKFLDVFDMAQKNGTIHMLNTTQILEKVRYETNNGYQSGGYTPNSGSVNNVDPSILISIIEKNTIAMEGVTNRLNEDIVAYSVISGDSGSHRQTQRYEALLKNATRKKT